VCEYAHLIVARHEPVRRGEHVARKTAVVRIVLQEVGHCRGIAYAVDGNDVDRLVVMFPHRAVHQPTDPAETLIPTLITIEILSHDRTDCGARDGPRRRFPRTRLKSNSLNVLFGAAGTSVMCERGLSAIVVMMRHDRCDRSPAFVASVVAVRRSGRESAPSSSPLRSSHPSPRARPLA
jgi:hypothetical protein